MFLPVCASPRSTHMTFHSTETDRKMITEQILRHLSDAKFTHHHFQCLQLPQANSLRYQSYQLLVLRNVFN